VGAAIFVATSLTMAPRIALWLLITLQVAAQAAEAAKSTAMAVAQEQNGTYVVDLVSRLAWPRCVEGMLWTGSSCTGTPALLNRGDAIARATQLTKTQGVQWRLPSAGELRGLLKNSAHPQGLDPVLFPRIAGEWVWSITVKVDTAPVNQYNYGNIMKGRNAGNTQPMEALTGMAVNMVTGATRSDVPKSTKLPVRLVLPQD
jgi:hypothetical protein